VKEGIHRLVALPYCLLVLVDDKACAQRYLSDVFGLTYQIFVQGYFV